MLPLVQVRPLQSFVSCCREAVQVVPQRQSPTASTRSMLHVWRPSGQALAALGTEEFKDVATLKGHLREVHGFPVYLQQLVHDGSILDDDTKLAAPMDLQLVLLTLPAFHQPAVP